MSKKSENIWKEKKPYKKHSLKNKCEANGSALKSVTQEKTAKLQEKTVYKNKK